VLALDPASGKTLWQVALADATRLAWIDGTLVVVTTTAIRGLSADAGTVVWDTPMGEGAPAASPVAAGRWIAVATGPGGLQFLDPATGKRVRVLDGGQGIDGAMATSKGRGYVLGNAGTFFALDLP